MKRRQAFTIVELLVAMALIMFIMAILSGAFVSATNTFRNLKASGDMAEKLRATSQLLQRDLGADHFEGKKRLSSTNFWLNGPPEQGFFQVFHGSPSVPVGTQGGIDFIEGVDLGNVGSFRSIDHSLAFTIKIRGNQMGDFLSASGAMAALSGQFGPSESRYQAGAYNYQWAEVAWFLVPSLNPVTGAKDTTVADLTTGSPSVPLFTLIRRQRLAVPDNSLVPQQPATPASLAQFLEVSGWVNNHTTSPTIYFNSPSDLTVPQRRFGGSMTPPPPTGTYPTPLSYMTIAQELTALNTANSSLAGADIQLTDVVSFDVRMLEARASTSVVDPFATLFDPPFSNNFTYTSPLPPGATARVFDTWSGVNDGLNNYSQWNVPLAQQNPQVFGTTLPLLNGESGPIIQAIQISIRIWDSKTNQTRQVTIVQAM